MKKKPMTLEYLAGMVQRGFNGIEDRMATKEDFRLLDRKIDETREVLAKAIADLETKLSAYMTPAIAAQRKTINYIPCFTITS